MNIWQLVSSLILSISWVSVIVNGSVTVKEVGVGSLVELPCLSNDDNHRFMFWELLDPKNIVSPGNPLDTKKYSYDVLTGKLIIRSVSSAESGFYKCVSRGIDDVSAINIQAIELIVNQDWEELWENDFETNLLRGLTAIMLLVVAAAAVLHVVTSKRQRNVQYFGIDASRENSPPYYRGDLQGTASNVGSRLAAGEDLGFDNSTVDVDFPKVFSQMHQDQAVGVP